MTSIIESAGSLDGLLAVATPGTQALTPVQLIAYQKLDEALGVSPVVALAGPSGSGRTTLVGELARQRNASVIGVQQIFEACTGIEGPKWEEAIERLIMQAFERNRLVILDDFTVLGSMSMNAGTRGQFFPLIVTRHVIASVIARGLQLLLVGPTPQAWESTTDYFSEQAKIVFMPDFTARDYQVFIAGLLGEENIGDLDFPVLYRYASGLNGYQLVMACRFLKGTGPITTNDFIECLQNRVLFSNTRVNEVEKLGFDTLPGTEEIVEALETNVILPFEHRELAEEMGLKPKRGVLLYGPPGTGKTSIGRALAHRIKGKFFLIDGSFISEPPGAFFNSVQRVVEEAKEHSPSVLFIDDADVLFNIQHIAGLARYLLSLLDGLESETASNVCVMMTAMDVSKVPEALLRSGRVELWLETKVPSKAVRERILQRWIGTEMPDYQDIDFEFLAQATSGFTAADLRRIAADAKSLYAADIVANAPIKNAFMYACGAINEIVSVRARMAETLGDEGLRAGHMIDIIPAHSAA